ncbi:MULTISPECIES: SDR family NAD(P)-dependent oxidoreductase [Citricoccus]|uniref:SDR family NAD(P)-dependent oxidoreductase n=1 Tax=Citricoccus TaxID=169133 RepID=UPI000255DFD5|nr:glucose 1-dehydrogenase [Citricoccus sp. CH26A]
MDYQLDGAVMIITGGAGGIGATTARLAIEAGCRVVIADINSTAAEATVSDLTSAGGEAVYVECDLTDPLAIERLVAETVEVFGGIDVLFNNAGVADAMLTDKLAIDELPIEVWDRVFDINVKAMFLLCRAAYPHLKKSDRAAIVNVGSVGSISAFPHTLAYGASKGAVALLTKNLALELSDDAIRVNAICPATTETQMTKDYLEAQGDPELAARHMAASHLAGRLGQPQDIANVTMFLASPLSSFVTGAVWLADGGQLAWRGQKEVVSA